MTCEDKDQMLQFSIDYVCALAETLLCFLCKKLIKQPHSCINSDCSKVFCYLCVHKFDKCPNCYAKYSDKSYLEYYESAEMHQEFLFSMIGKFQEENVKLPLLIRKILAQNNSASNKNKTEIGNSSKQTEFPESSSNDYYSMQIENNPNIINNVSLDQRVNDSDEESMSNGNTTSDPAWTPDDSPKLSTKMSLRARIKKAGQTKITKEVKELKTIKPKKKGGASTKLDSLPSLLKEDSEKNKSDSIENKYIEDIKAWGVKNSKSLTESLERNKTEEDTSEEEVTRAPDSSVSSFDKLLQECSEEAINKSSSIETNDSNKKSQSELDELAKLDTNSNNVELVLSSTWFHNAQENVQKTSNRKDEEESSDSNENGMSPSVARLKLDTPKTYGKKQNSSTEFLNHMKNASTLFDLKEDDEEIIEKENDADQCSKKKSLNSILNKYSVLDLDKEGNSPIKKYKSSLKRKSKDLEEKNDSEEFNELFRTKKEIKSFTRRRNKILEDDQTFQNLDNFNSKDSSVANVNLNLNKNTSEIENLIQSKKFKIDNIVIEELPSKDFESNQRDSNDVNRKEIDSILSADKEINIVTKNTRQRKVSKCDTTFQPDVSNSKETKKNEPRQRRRKRTSESSADTSVIKNTRENLENITNKRTRGTPRNTSTRNSKTTKIENNENKPSENDKVSTPKTNSRKKPIKTATCLAKNTEAIKEDSLKDKVEEKTSEINSKFFEQSTPKTNTRKRVSKAATLSDASSSKSASSKNTSEYFTPLSETPRSVTTLGGVVAATELSTPKTSLVKKRSVFKEPPEKFNMTPVVKTPSSAKKSTVMNPMYKRNMKGETPLHTACKKDANKVISLLKNNMTPNVKDNAGWTPLHDAVSMGKEAVVRLLLEAGALVNVPGLDNDTPLHLAVRSERIDLAQLLIQYGADVELRNINGYKPLDYCDLVHRPDWKSSVLAALQWPRLVAPPAPLPPSPADVVLHLDHLDRAQTSLVVQFSRGLAAEDRAVLVSPLLQSNVNILLVAGGRGDTRLCSPSTNVLKAILSGIKAVDIAWIARCLALNQLVPTEEYEILATTDYPDARPFKRSAENNAKLLPGLFNGLQVYLARPWPAFSVLPCDEARDLLRRGGASLLNREPDPESMGGAESSPPRVMYHVTDPAHPLYRLSQGILYDEQAPPRRLYNMSHVKALSVEWFRACVQTFSIVPPLHPTMGT